MQEYLTAKEAILDACPAAKVRGRREHKFPITVSVKYNEREIWNSPQQRLFYKFSDHRSASIEEIKIAVTQLDLQACKRSFSVIKQEK